MSCSFSLPKLHYTVLYCTVTVILFSCKITLNVKLDLLQLFNAYIVRKLNHNRFFYCSIFFFYRKNYDIFTIFFTVYSYIATFVLLIALSKLSIKNP